MDRPSDAAIARAFETEAAGTWPRDALRFIEQLTARASAIDAEAKESYRTLTSVDAKERIDAEAKGETGAVVNPTFKHDGLWYCSTCGAEVTCP